MGEEIGPNEESLEITDEQVNQFLKWVEHIGGDYDIKCIIPGCSSITFKSSKDDKSQVIKMYLDGNVKTIKHEYGSGKDSFVEIISDVDPSTLVEKEIKRNNLNKESLALFLSELQYYMPTVSERIRKELGNVLGS